MIWSLPQTFYGVAAFLFQQEGKESGFKVWK